MSKPIKGEKNSEITKVPAKEHFLDLLAATTIDPPIQKISRTSKKRRLATGEPCADMSRMVLGKSLRV